MSTKSFRESLSFYLAERTVCREYENHLWRTLRRMEAAGIVGPEDATVESLNSLLHSIGASACTKAANRRQVGTILRAAIGPDAEHLIRRIRRIKVVNRPPVAWCADEMARLVTATDGMTGKLLSGCPAGLFFRAFVMTGYYTGFRFSDLHGLRVEQLRGARLHVVQHKTGQPIAKLLPPEAVDALELLANHPANTDRKTFFLWALKEHWLRVHFRRLCKAAGVSGSPKWLRRSGATAVEAQSPGSASRFLGHLSPELAMKHYVDQSLLPNAVPVPPSLALPARQPAKTPDCQAKSASPASE